MLIFLSILDTEEEKTKFEKIYDKYIRFVEHAAFRILEDEQLSEDAAHETFIRVAYNLHKIGEIDSAKTRRFLYVIAKNISLTIKEGQQKQKNLLSMQEIKFQGSAEKEALDKLNCNEVLSVLKKMPTIYQEILILYTLDKYSLPDIARMLNISTDAAWKRLQRGRKLLRNKITNERELR